MSKPSWGDTDVMEEHFNHPDSCTYSVSGSQLKYQRKKNENICVKLHISGIPLELTESGLKNVFMSTGLKPTHTFICAKKNSNNMKWGFVEFNSASEAQTAIIDFNKRPPYFFGVSFAHTEENKKKVKVGQSELAMNDFKDFQRSPDSSMRSTDRGKPPQMQGKPPSNFKSNYPEEELYCNDIKQKDFSFSQFSHPDDSLKTTASNSVFSPLSDGIYDNGQRKMSMGRGSYISNNKKLNTSTPENPKEKHRYEIITEELDTKVAAYISKRFRDLSCNTNYKLSTEMQLSLPFKLGQCVYCGRPSIYSCSRCKAWYCCNSCREDDYPEHIKTCTPKKIIFDPAGNISFLNEPDEFESSSLPPKVSEHKNNSNDDSGHVYAQESNGNDYMNRSSDSNRENHGDNLKKKKKDSDSYYIENQKKREGLEAVGSRNTQRRSGRGDSNQSTNHMDRSGGGSRTGGNKTGVGGSYQDKRSTNRRNQNAENKVYVRQTSLSPECVKNSNQIKEKIPTVEPPLPYSKFTMVRVGALGTRKGEFWAYTMDNEVQQSKILLSLNKHCLKAPPLPYVESGMLVCAPFDGDRYRGRVIKTDGSEVNIFFIDFGNSIIVNSEELCQMPSEIEAIPPLAHHFILGNSQDNPPIVEEETMKIKPIKQDLEGRWIVHLEDVPYNDTKLQEVYSN